MSINHTSPAALWHTNAPEASAPELAARELLEEARTHPLGSPEHRALVHEAGVHATLANVWATEAVFTRLEDLTDLLNDSGRDS